MKRIAFLCIFICLSVFISCRQVGNSEEKINNPTYQQQPNKYNLLFRVLGYYIRYDGLHYKYMLSSADQVKEIIKYYYPDCFDIVVYNPGSPETGYLNIYFYATWKSYLGYVEIK